MTAIKDPYSDITFNKMIKFDGYQIQTPKFFDKSGSMEGLVIAESDDERAWRRKDIMMMLKRFIGLSKGNISEGFILFMDMVNDVLVQDLGGCPVSDYLNRPDVLSHLHGLLNALEEGKELTVNRQEMIEQVEDVIGEFE